MQGLWSRSGLSSHSCRCISCLSTGTNAVAGRTATAASRRRLFIGNSVTAFYGTIFATAMFWDVNVKQKKRQEWEKQIETIREDIKQLQDEEARLVEGWAVRRRERQLALPMQRRQYSTATGAQIVEPERSHNVQRPTLEAFARRHDTLSQHDRPDLISDTLDAGLMESDPIDVFDPDGCSSPVDLVSDDFLRERAIQQLAMKQLAIKLLLRPSIAHSYGEIRQFDKSESSLLLKLEPKELLSQVNSIKNRIRYLKNAEHLPPEDLAPNIGIQEHRALVQERHEMHHELQETFRQFADGDLSLTRLLLIVSNHLLHSPEPIPPNTIELLITRFSRAKQNDIVIMIMETIFPNRFPISIPVITSSINFFNKTKDLFRFDGFLRFLQGDSFPVSPQIGLWNTVTVEGVEVPVPPKPCHPMVMNALVSAALSFDQPQRANAWLHVLRQAGYFEGPAVIGSLMRYYSVTPNWRDGRYTLQKALTCIWSTKAHPKSQIERLILYMVILCNCCGQTQLSQALIEAAVTCGLDWKDCCSETDWRVATQKAVQQWRDAAGASIVEVPLGLSVSERCHRFAYMVRGMVQRAVMTPIPLEGSPETGRDPIEANNRNLNTESRLRVPKLSRWDAPVKKARAPAPKSWHPSTVKITQIPSNVDSTPPKSKAIEDSTPKTSRTLHELNRHVPRSAGIAL